MLYDAGQLNLCRIPASGLRLPSEKETQNYGGTYLEYTSLSETDQVRNFDEQPDHASPPTAARKY